jgi:hypothetical protein
MMMRKSNRHPIEAFDGGGGGGSQWGWGSIERATKKKSTQRSCQTMTAAQRQSTYRELACKSRGRGALRPACDPRAPPWYRDRSHGTVEPALWWCGAAAAVDFPAAGIWLIRWSIRGQHYAPVVPVGPRRPGRSKLTNEHRSDRQSALNPLDQCTHTHTHKRS